MDKLGFSKWSKIKRGDEVGGVVLSRGDDRLEIAFLGNQDLYFVLDNYEQRKDFVVGKDNFEVYEAFDKLYDKISKGLLYNFKMSRTPSDLGLMQGDKIVWKSDDYSEDVAPYFSIEKGENAYVVSFNKPEPQRELDFDERLFLDYPGCSVRLRNSGSRYEPFNIDFMYLFRALKEINPDVHQIDVEEVIIDQEVAKGKSLEKVLVGNRKLQ